jgi:hypothetical protein
MSGVTTTTTITRPDGTTISIPPAGGSEPAGYTPKVSAHLARLAAV